MIMNVLFYSGKNNDNNEDDTVLPVPSSTSKEKSWCGKGVILVPTKFFQFVELKKNGKGFLVKCLKCHESKTAYNRKGEIELLAITANSVYNARKHIEVPYFFISVFNLIIFPCGLVVFTLN